MNISVPKEAESIIEKLQHLGFEAFVVGGCVRDSLLGITPKDWDITTNALPEDIKKAFPVTIDTGIAHGTVTVRLNKKSFEVTTYRTDGDYLDGRHPDSVTFVKSLKEDLRRRDFTVNALAYNKDTGIVDEFGGLKDLESKTIRCVEDPKKRFSEDALRMLRALRFIAQLGFFLDEATKAAIKELSFTIKKVSVERICDEFVKLITTDRPETILELYSLGLTKVFLPEWDEMMDTPQNTPHHRGSVGEHSVYVMQNVPATKELRLAALLHDVAKPISRKEDNRGRDHFAGHPQIGANMTKDILRRLKMDNDTISYVSRLVRFHDDRPPLNMKTVRRCLNRMGEDLFPDIFTLRYADIMGQSDYKREEKLAEIEVFKEYYDRIMEERECVSLSGLAIKGADIMALGMSAGPIIGEALNSALELVIDDPSKNNKETLLEYINEQYIKNRN